MKKWIAALLTIALLMQAANWTAFAATGDMISDAELQRALRLAGLQADTGAGQRDIVAVDSAYHEGMVPEDTWNAGMLSDWLDDKLSREIYHVNNVFTRVDTMLATLQTDDPKAYARFTDGSAYSAEYPAKCREWMLDIEALEEEAQYCQTRTRECITVIEQNAELLANETDGLFDYEKARLSEQIREATVELEALRDAIVDISTEELVTVTSAQSIIDGTAEPEFSAWMSAVLDADDDPKATHTSTATVRKSAPSTRVARMSANESVLSEAATQDVRVLVISENEFTIVIKGTDNKPVVGVPVTVKDLNGKAVKTAMTQDASIGYAKFDANDFVCNYDKEMEISLEVDGSAQGYRSFSIPWLIIKRGGHRDEHLDPLEGSVSKANGAGRVAFSAAEAGSAVEPYIRSACFNGYDILRQDKTTIISSLNDAAVNFEVVVEHASGASVKAPVLHYWQNERSDHAVAPKEKTMTPTSTQRVSDTQTKYIWRSTWKRDLSPDINDEQRPFFVLPDTDEKIETTLVPVRAAIDEPTVQPGDFTMENVMGEGFGTTFEIPGIGGDLSLNLPFKKYLPKFKSDATGYFTFSMGSTLTDPDWPTEWKSTEAEKYDKAMKDYEHATTLAERKQQLGAAKEFYKQGKGIGQTSFDFGWFVMICGKKQKDEEDETALWAGSGAIGVTFTFEADYTKPFTIGPVPFYLNINFAASAGFGVDALTFTFKTTKDFKFQNYMLQPLKGFTIEICLALTVTFGMGIKDLLSVWVAAEGSLNIIVQILMDDPQKVAVYFEALISAGFEIFWIKYSRKVYNFGKARIYSNYDIEARAMPFDLFTAYAEESSGDKPVEMMPQEPDRYAALAPQATRIISNEENARAGIKVVRCQDYTYVFYLGTVKGSDGKAHRRLCWRELNTGKTGSIEGKVSGLDDTDDYDFDVIGSTGENAAVYFLVLSGRNFDETTGLPKASFDDRESNVNTFYYWGWLSPQNGGDLNDSYVSDRLTWWARERETCYPVCANPHIERAVERVDVFARGMNLYGTLDGYDEHGERAGYDLFVLETVIAGGTYRFSKDSGVKGPWKDDESYQRVALRSNIRSNDTLGQAYDNRVYGFAAVSRPAGNARGDSYLELFDYDMNGASPRRSLALDQGDIGAFEPIQTLGSDGWSVTQTIFYTKGQTAGDRTEYRLKSIRLAPKHGRATDFSFSATYTDYDVTIPYADFHVMALGDAGAEGPQYLYWLSANTKKKDGDPDVWRVNGVYFDPQSGLASDEVVLAEFTLPDAEWKGRKYKSVPLDVTLTDDGFGFITAKPNTGDENDHAIAPMTLYRFPLVFKPVADLKKAATAETTLVQGEFIETDLSLMNVGNMAITAFDVELWQMDGDREVKKIETLHADCLDPANSSLVLHDAKGDQTVAKGEKAFYRYKDFGFSARQRDWTVKQEDKTITVKNHDQFSTAEGSARSNRVSSNVLVPGTLGCYNGSIKIPTDWVGQYSLRFKLTKLSTNTNWVGAVSKADSAISKGSGTAMMAANDRNAVFDGNGIELTYALDERSGALVLQDQDGDSSRLLFAAGEADETLTLYPDSIEAPAPVEIDVDLHDIDVDHRLYEDSFDDEMLDIIINNYHNNDQSIELTCAIYVNDEDAPYYVSLPYDPKEVSAGKTTTITLPLDALIDVESTEVARFVISARGVDETALFNNEFTIYPGGSSPLSIASQPVSQTVKPGESAVFSVGVTGGKTPYAYQWQVFVDGEWQDIPSATGTTLMLDKVKPEWNGRRTRCVVTDAEGTVVISQEAVLTVVGGGSGFAGDDDHPDTGDHSNLPLYLIVALVAMALLLLMRRKERE